MSETSSSSEVAAAGVPAAEVHAEQEPAPLPAPESDMLSAAPGGAQEGELVDEGMWGAIAALRERGVAKKAIARQLGLDVKTVRKWWARVWQVQHRRRRGRVLDRWVPFLRVRAPEVGFSSVVLSRELAHLGQRCSLLARGVLPFDRPALAKLSFGRQVAFPSLGLLEVFALMAVVYWLTRRREIPDLAARAPGRPQAARETTLLLTYAAVGQVGGWVVGPALGYRPFSFHVAGTLVGCSVPAGVGEICTWAVYNFVVFAVIPYVWFRRRYSAMELNLRSTDRANDLLVIVVVAVIESFVELGAFDGILHMNVRQLTTAVPLSLAVFLIGTVLPTMVLIYSILVPRYLKLTGSSTTTVLLGGITYAAMHLVEGWSLFNTPRNAALSLLLVGLGYFGPGMIKTFLTLRTGNAWVHAIGYHAIAPHVVVDAPLIAKAFGLR